MSRSAKPRESVEEYLARGGQITVVPTGVSAIDPLKRRSRKEQLAHSKNILSAMTGRDGRTA
jgi:hypothetical protein